MSAQRTLQSILNTVDRAVLVREVADLIKAEIYAKRGLRGMALQKAHSVTLRLFSSIDEKAVNYLLDDVIVALEPHYAKCIEGGSLHVDVYFDLNKDAIAKSLLDVVDHKASLLKNKHLYKIYKTFRPRIEREVAPAMPKIGILVSKYQ